MQEDKKEEFTESEWDGKLMTTEGNQDHLESSANLISMPSKKQAEFNAKKFTSPVLGEHDSKGDDLEEDIQQTPEISQSNEAPMKEKLQRRLTDLKASHPSTIERVQIGMGALENEKNLEFYPAQSERSRLNGNQSQINFNQQPSETSTNNLLQYSQSLKINDIDSIHQNDVEMLRQIQNLNEEQKKMMIHQGSLLGMIQIGDDSINFSNLDSSINPSMYTEKNETREKQFAKLQQQQKAILKAQQDEAQQRKLKVNFQSSSDNIKQRGEDSNTINKKKSSSPVKRKKEPFEQAKVQAPITPQIDAKEPMNIPKVPNTAQVADKKQIDSPNKKKRSESKSPTKKMNLIVSDTEMTSFLSPSATDEQSKTEQNSKQKPSNNKKAKPLKSPQKPKETEKKDSKPESKRDNIHLDFHKYNQITKLNVEKKEKAKIAEKIPSPQLRKPVIQIEDEDLPHAESILIEEGLIDLPDAKATLTLDQYFEKMNVNKQKAKLHVQTKPLEFLNLKETIGVSSPEQKDNNRVLDEIHGSAQRYSRQKIDSDDDPFYEGFNEEKHLSDEKGIQLRTTSNEKNSPSKGYKTVGSVLSEIQRGENSSSILGNKKQPLKTPQASKQKVQNKMVINQNKQNSFVKDDLIPQLVDQNRPFSQGNAQSDYISRQPKRIISNQINNIQNQFNHYNQYIVTKEDMIKLSKDQLYGAKVGSGLGSYRKAYNNLNEFAQNNTYVQYDDFIINDDGSQSANMMMLDGEYDPLIKQNSLGSFNSQKKVDISSKEYVLQAPQMEVPIERQSNVILSPMKRRQSQLSPKSHISVQQTQEFIQKQSQAYLKKNSAVEQNNGFNRVKEEMKLLKQQRELEKQIAIKRKKEKRYTKEQLIRIRLPPNVLLKIIQNLNLKETFRMLRICKYIRETIIYNADFEGQWVIKSFQGLLSKSGFSGLRNNQLRQIDIRQRAMHFQSESILLDCKAEQWYVYRIWCNFAFILIFILTPILLIIDEEKDLGLDTKTLFLPTTLTWVLLFITLMMTNKKISSFHLKVLDLDYQKQYQSFRDKGTPQGRCTKHCRRYQRSQFEVRFLSHLIYVMLFLYLGVFIKLYIFDWLQENQVLRLEYQMKWAHVSIISFVPVFVLYTREIIKEARAGKQNLEENREMLLNCITLSINKSMSDNQIIDKFGKQ